jgi:hypothetical protein
MVEIHVIAIFASWTNFVEQILEKKTFLGKIYLNQDPDLDVLKSRT